MRDLSVFNFDPFNSLFDVDFDNLIPERFLTLENGKISRYPLTNIGRDSNNNLIIEIACAGFDQDELQIETEENMIVVNGKHKETSTDVKYIQNHISTNTFTRKIYMVPLYVGGEISAVYKNGILTLTVQPNEARKPKQIQIKSLDALDYKEDAIDVQPEEQPKETEKLQVKTKKSKE